MQNPLIQKLIPQSKIKALINNLKKQNKVVVTYNGSFDVLHAGHIGSLLEAKAQGDVLIVPLNSDQSVKSYKGHSRPIISEKERALQLATLECVDYVVLFNETNCIKILDKIKPDIHCNGRDWGKNCVEREIVEKNGGKIYILSWTQGLSTTKLIQKIIDLYKKPVNKAVFLDRNGTINISNPKVSQTIQSFQFAPGAIEALKKLAKTKYKIIIITNRSDVAKGLCTEKDVLILNNWIKKNLKEKGARIDHIFYCPHHPEAVIQKYKKNCPCRKPGTGMLEKARDKYNLSLNDSWLVGDSIKDVLAGRLMNIKTIQIKTCGEKTADIQSKIGPQFKAKDLKEAIEKIILKK